MKKIRKFDIFDASNTSQKGWKRAMFTTVLESPVLLTTALKCLETKEASCWSSGRRLYLCIFLFDTVFQLLVSPESSLSYLLFHDLPNVFKW